MTFISTKTNWGSIKRLVCTCAMMLYFTSEFSFHSFFPLCLHSLALAVAVPKHRFGRNVFITCRTRSIPKRKDCMYIYLSPTSAVSPKPKASLWMWESHSAPNNTRQCPRLLCGPPFRSGGLHLADALAPASSPA